MFKYLILLGITGGLFGCSQVSSLFQHYPEDNIIEEALEEIIRNESGIDIDVSPFSQEASVKAPPYLGYQPQAPGPVQFA